MPAGGNDGVAAVEVYYAETADVVKVHIDTKKSDETDAAATSIGSAVVTSATPDLYQFKVGNAKDLVRYRIENTDDALPVFPSVPT